MRAGATNHLPSRDSIPIYVRLRSLELLRACDARMMVKNRRCEHVVSSDTAPFVEEGYMQMHGYPGSNMHVAVEVKRRRTNISAYLSVERYS